MIEGWAWVEEFRGGVTVCDREGVIVYLNAKAAKTFEKEGGKALIGSNLFECHPEPARTQLKELMDHETFNCYTIEKAGVKKLIYQTPWHQDGAYQGFIELSLEIPFTLPHFVRTPPPL